MRPATWQPPVETAAAEEQISKRIKRAKLFIFLRRHRQHLFTPEFQVEWAGLYKDAAPGHPPVPPALLARALLLQAYTGVADDEVMEATGRDRRWPLALECVDAAAPPFRKGTCVALRTRLSERQMDRRLLERTTELAAARKACGPRNLRAALDSSPLWGAGGVEDTDTLLGHALRKALGVIAREPGGELAAIAQAADAELVAGSSRKAVRDRAWDDPTAREQAVRQGSGTLERVEPWLAAQPALLREPSPVPGCLAAAQQVLKQDVMPNEAGAPTLLQGVATNRRISSEAPEMRHGRKSRSGRVDGYKRPVLRALDSELGVAVGLTPANAPEASVAEGIKSDLQQPQRTLKELHIDRAYLASTLVSERRAEGEIVCKAGPVRAGPFCPQTAFGVDWERQRLRCPPGVELVKSLDSCKPS